MKISLIAERVLRATRRYSFAELAARLWRLTVRSVSPKKHLVYLYEAPPENALLPCDDIVLLDVTSRSEEAEVYRRQMEEEEGVYHTRDLLNWALTGARVYYLMVGEQVIGHAATIRGEFVETWYRELKPSDTVIYGVTVFRDHRGHGYAPASYVVLAETYRKVGNVYIDTLSDNMPARRAIEKAGFTLIDTVRKMTWRNALHHVPTAR